MKGSTKLEWWWWRIILSSFAVWCLHVENNQLVLHWSWMKMNGVMGSIVASSMCKPRSINILPHRAKAESTRVIEDGITQNDEGHNGEEIRQNHCCARHEKVVDVGEGISRQVISIDAGHCRRLCPRHVLDDPGDASRPAVQRCPPNSHCHPRSARLERVSTLQGVKVIETVDTCDCSLNLACRRESFKHLVHSGTPYQVVIDVGVCMGFCDKDLGCKPHRNRTVSVNGPNGAEVYQAIEKCGCAGNCHRMDHTESVLDFSEIEIKEGVNTSEVKPIVREINVGQCVGSCPGNETETCLLRDKKEPKRCLAGLYSKQHNCTPASFKVHEYRTRRGSRREVIQIAECACV